MNWLWLPPVPEPESVVDVTAPVYTTFFTGSYCQICFPLFTLMEPAGNCANVDWSTTVRFLFADTFHISLSRVPLSAGPLIFTLKTHSDLFGHTMSDEQAAADPYAQRYVHAPVWSVNKAILVLLLASAAVAVLAELLVGSAEVMAEHLGWSGVFVGVILLAIIGNAAEHSTAVMLARYRI